MNKKYYQILGVAEDATPDKIKENYRKLAMKYHPDRFANKSKEEFLEANQKMQELNEAYAVLGSPELRERYDREGDKSFSENNTNFNPESDPEYARWKEELKRGRERSELLRKLEKIIREEVEIMTRMCAAGKIDWEFHDNEWARVEDLDNNLWAPYKTYGDKIAEEENLVIFTEEGGIDKENSPIYKWLDEMCRAIRESHKKRKREHEKREETEFKSYKKKIIQRINSKLENNNLKKEDLNSEYKEYENQINNFSNCSDIESFYEKLKVHIDFIPFNKPRHNQKGSNQGLNFKSPETFFTEFDKNPEQIAKAKPDILKKLSTGEDYENWPKENLIKLIKKLKEDKKDQAEIISSLQTRISDLEQEIELLRGEQRENEQRASSSSRFNLLSKKQQKHREYKEILHSLLKEKEEFDKPTSESNNKFPIAGLALSGMVLGVLAIAGIIIYRKTKKIK